MKRITPIILSLLLIVCMCFGCSAKSAARNEAATADMYYAEERRRSLPPRFQTARSSAMRI